MASNSFGEVLRLTSFGESHGPAMGGILDGMPAGVAVDMGLVGEMLRRRRPGSSPTVSARRETDSVEILSGIFEGVTLGTPIGFIVRNSDVRSADYGDLRHAFRPNHGDFTWQAKYGLRDYRGGGRASARETVARVVAGSIAFQALSPLGISVEAFPVRIADVNTETPSGLEEGRRRITDVRREKDSVGGVVGCRISGCPTGLGDPVFGKLQSRLASAMMSIPAAKGFEYGLGFAAAEKRGSEVIDEFFADAEGHVHTRTNFSGGIQGGISNGQPIEFRIAFKPVATIEREMATVSDLGKNIVLTPRGRHDPCIVERVLPVVEAMAALVVLDSVLLARLSRI